MHWILQDNIFDEVGYQKLVEFLTRFDIPFSQHKVIPFIGEISPDINPTGNVICIGTYSFRHLAKRRNWYPGVFDLEPYDFTIQMQHWGDLMLNSDAVVVPFKDAVVEDVAFIRPIHDSKVFAGMQIEKNSLIEWQGNMAQLQDQGISMTEDTLIQVCPLKQIVSEHRYWIVDGKIITKSQYKSGSTVFYNSNVDERFDVFVQQCIDIWQPLPAFVIDVCELVDNQLKIVEINTINSAGFYHGDMAKLAYTLQEKYGDKNE